MFSINTNTGAMAALESLNSTTASLNQTQSQISTGLKVATASDNPAVYSIGQTMSANLAGLSAVQDSLTFGQSAVGLAVNTAASISSQLSTLQATVTQAQTGGMNAATMNAQVSSILTDINQMASSATINGVNLLDGTSGSMKVVQNINGSQLSVPNQNATASGLGLSNLLVTASAVNLSFDNSFAVANQDKVVLSNGSQSYTFQFSNGTAPLTSTPSPTNTVVAVQVDPTTQSNMEMVGAMVSAMNQQGFGAVVNTDGSVTVSGNGITNAASTESFASGGATQTPVSGALAAVSVVQSAINTMNTKSAALGAAANQITAMQTFSKSLGDSLTTGLGALTDADMAAESAKLQSLQTKQQLAIQSLSIANQQPQALLSLFRG